MAEPKHTPVATTVRANPLAVVVAALQAAPETINPATELYFRLYLEYTFGALDLGNLLFQRGEFNKALEDGKASQEKTKAMLKGLKDLPSRSSRYVPL